MKPATPKFKMDPAMVDFLGTSDPEEYQTLMAQFMRNLISTLQEHSKTPQGRKRLRKACLPFIDDARAQELLVEFELI